MDALFEGSLGKDTSSDKGNSVAHIGKKASVTVNKQAGVLIQCNLNRKKKRRK